MSAAMQRPLLLLLLFLLLSFAAATASPRFGVEDRAQDFWGVQYPEGFQMPGEMLGQLGPQPVVAVPVATAAVGVPLPMASVAPQKLECRSVKINPLSLEALNQIPTPVLSFLTLTCGQDERLAKLSKADGLPATNGDDNAAQNPKADEAQCGTGVCDDIRDQFRFNPPAGSKPDTTFKMRFVVMDEPGGKGPTATEEQIAGQAGTLNWAYGPVGVQFDVEALFCNSPSLRNVEINPPTDLAGACVDDKKGNGQCSSHLEEAEAENGGTSQNSIDRNEFRRLVNAPQDNRLNIYVHRFKDSGQGSLVFKAYTENFPWEGPVSEGMIISPDYFNANMNVLVHEVGHIFGLLHVHHGVSETRGQEQNCMDPCYESMNFITTPLEGKGYVNNYRGDLCSDTPPTPKNYYCNQPPGVDACAGNLPWSTQNSPFRNFMGYGPNECRSEWTEQQIARMRCWMNQSDMKKYIT